MLASTTFSWKFAEPTTMVSVGAADVLLPAGVGLVGLELLPQPATSSKPVPMAAAVRARIDVMSSLLSSEVIIVRAG